MRWRRRKAKRAVPAPTRATTPAVSGSMCVSSVLFILLRVALMAMTAAVSFSVFPEPRPSSTSPREASWYPVGPPFLLPPRSIRENNKGKTKEYIQLQKEKIYSRTGLSPPLPPSALGHNRQHASDLRVPKESQDLLSRSLSSDHAPGRTSPWIFPLACLSDRPPPLRRRNPGTPLATRWCWDCRSPLSHRQHLLSSTLWVFSQK